MKVLRIVGSFGFISQGKWLKPIGNNNFIGGTQIQSYLITKKLSSKGIKQDIFTRDARVSNFDIKNATFYSCGSRGDIFFPLYAILYSNNKNYDLIHAHIGISPFIPLTALILAKLKRIPLICTVNLSWEGIKGHSLLSKLVNRLIQRLVLKHSAIIISLNHNHIDGKYKFIPDAVEDRFFKTEISKKRSPFILFVGRFVYQKGIDILLRAYGKSKLSSLGISLVLIGDNKNYIKTKLPSSVYIHECPSREEIAELMSKTLGLILPSRFEERGTVIGEALASGTPVLTSDLSNIRSAYSDTIPKAIIYSSIGENPLAESLVKTLNLFSNLTLEERKRFREYARNFSEDRVSNAYLDLYKQITTRDKSK